MIRHATIAVLACLYVALSVWVVGRQGQAYREGLRRERLAAAHADEPAPEQPVLKSSTPAPTVPVIASSRPAAAPAAAVVAPKATERTTDHSQPLAKSDGPSKPKSTPLRVAARSAEPATQNPSAPADPLAGNPLWTAPR